MAERRITVRLTPRADRDAVVGERDGVLHVRVVAPPVDGKANAALVKILAKHFGVPRGCVVIARGETSRHKVVHVTVPD